MQGGKGETPLPFLSAAALCHGITVRCAPLVHTDSAGFLLNWIRHRAQSATATVHPREQVVLPGDQVKLMCRTGVPIVYCRMETPRGGKPLFLNPSTKVTTTGDPVYYGEGYEKGQCGMMLQRASDRDNGVWKCTMGNAQSAEELVETAIITVARAPVQPQIFLTPSDSTTGDGNRYELVAGKSVHASCSIPNGRPPANLTWFIGDQPVTDGLSRLEETRGTVNETWTVSQNLTREVTWQDNGKYLRCISQHLALTNAAMNESRIMLNVTYPPQPQLSSPTEQFGFEVGKEGIIKVQIQANPTPRVVWEVDGKQVQEGSTDPENHYQASIPENLGGGTWEATLRITRVEETDINKQFTLKASNYYGSETYKISLSTSSEPTVMELGAGSIIGIVVAILFVLLVIFLVIFARATGRWCFAGGVSSSRNDIRESSDTESADHGPANKTKTPKMNLSYIFNKKKDKVSDEPPEPPKMEPEMQPAAEPLQQKTSRGDIVYAELDLKDVAGKPRPQVRPEEDRTEYAEIVYTAKSKEPDLQEK
ncbi:fasciclin-3 [Schistocerca americana]|uniref:fasciclin-3 n=1 Tax=Schistocerca americana TaxID=7009 RepID=UPI001F4F9A59|nr:fasciclin-3 [Schistocerca americana]